MIENDLVSIILPVRNSSKTLSRSIDSIINQTYKNIELIIIDDYSHDNSVKIIKDYLKIDKRIKFYKSDFNDQHRFLKNNTNINAGYSSRNTGLNKATGKWITFQDSDDISLLNRIEIQLALSRKFKTKHLTTSCFHLDEHKHYLKKINFNKYINFKNIKKFECKPLINSNKIFLPLPDMIFKSIPFKLKCFPIIRKIILGDLDISYPGAANNCFFYSDYKKIKFRPLSLRRWPSSRGRGADKDFNFLLARQSYNPIFYDIPLYGWRTPTFFSNHQEISNFLI